MIKVGLTGGIGSGKSAVARLLEERGALVVDADVLARQVVAPGTTGLEQVVAEFGPEVLAPDGSLDRAAMAAVAFADPGARQRLEAIVHPLVGAETLRLFAAAGPDDVVVHDVPLLVEKQMQGLYDAVLVVQAPLETRLDRLEGRGLDRADALARIRAQASDEERAAVATRVIDNSGSLADLEIAVAAVWQELVTLRGRIQQPS